MIDHRIFSTNNLAKELALTFLSPSMRVMLWGRVLNPRSPLQGRWRRKLDFTLLRTKRVKHFLSPDQNKLGWPPIVAYIITWWHLWVWLGGKASPGVMWLDCDIRSTITWPAGTVHKHTAAHSHVMACPFCSHKSISEGTWDRKQSMEPITHCTHYVCSFHRITKWYILTSEAVAEYLVCWYKQYT